MDVLDLGGLGNHSGGGAGGENGWGDMIERFPHLTELHNLGNDLEEWAEIRVRKDTIPNGARLVEAYQTDREIIVMGFPKDDDENHNCDEMGCGSVGSHVMYRFERKE